jgi:hypothetical protein
MAAPRKTPLHVPVALGVTAGLYAVSLSGVTALQSHADGALTVERRPLANAIAVLASNREQLEHELRATVRSLNGAASAYGTAVDGARSLEASIATLARQVHAATGAAAAAYIPTASGLPSTPRTATVVVSAPAVHATTGASGKP